MTTTPLITDQAGRAHALVGFLLADCPREALTTEVYELASSTFGHDDSTGPDGFYTRWFATPAARAAYVAAALDPVGKTAPGGELTGIEAMLREDFARWSPAVPATPGQKSQGPPGDSREMCAWWAIGAGCGPAALGSLATRHTLRAPTTWAPKSSPDPTAPTGASCGRSGSRVLRHAGTHAPGEPAEHARYAGAPTRGPSGWGMSSGTGFEHTLTRVIVHASSSGPGQSGVPPPAACTAVRSRLLACATADKGFAALTSTSKVTSRDDSSRSMPASA